MRTPDPSPPAAGPASQTAPEAVGGEPESTGEVTWHRYGASALNADYARGVIGLLLTGGPLVLVPVAQILAVLFGACALLFAIYVVRTVLRQLVRVRLDDIGVAAIGPLGVAVRWSDLDDMRLRFYSTRRDREQGWMTLRLAGSGRRLHIESSIDGFDAIVQSARDAAVANGVTLSEATVSNLLALGIEGPEPPPPSDTPGDDDWVAAGRRALNDRQRPSSP